MNSFFVHVLQIGEQNRSFQTYGRGRSSKSERVLFHPFTSVQAFSYEVFL